MFSHLVICPFSDSTKVWRSDSPTSAKICNTARPQEAGVVPQVRFRLWAL